MVYTIQNHRVSGLCPSSEILNIENTAFRKLDLLQSLDERREVGVRLNEVSSFKGTQQRRCLPPLTWRQKQMQFPISCGFQLF
jgi:hypothetical protein